MLFDVQVHLCHLSIPENKQYIWNLFHFEENVFGLQQNFEVATGTNRNQGSGH